MTAATDVLRERTDPCWVDAVPGVPTLAPGARLLEAVVDRECDTHRVVVDDVALTPPGLQVRAVIDVAEDALVVQGGSEPVHDQTHLVAGRGRPGRSRREAGVSSARRGGPLVVTSATHLDRVASDVVVWRDVPLPGSPDVGRRLDRVARIASLAETPLVRPRVTLMRAGQRALRTAVLLPHGHVPGRVGCPC